MTIRKAKLEATLGEMILILERHDDKHWSEVLKQSLRKIRARNSSGIESLLKSYGGMGSFNDFVIQPKTKADEIEFTDEQIEANNKLDSLRRTAWTLAIELKHEN